MKTDIVVFDTDGVARMHEMELPPMTPSRVRVETALSGVSCGTERDCLSGRASYVTRPILPGYQAVGRLVEVGDDVRGLAPGEWVFVGPGSLWEVPNIGGTHARQSIREAASVLPVSTDAVALEDAAYIGLAAVALEGLARMKLAANETMLVLGLGMLGLMTGKLAQIKGLQVIGANRGEAKRDIASQYGLDAVCKLDVDEIRKTAGALGDRPVRYAADTTGQAACLDLAIDVLGPFSELTLLGYYPEPVLFDFDRCHARNLSIHNPVGHGKRFGEILDVMQTRGFSVKSLISHRVAPASVNEYFAGLLAGETPHLGAVIDWR